MPLPNAIYLLVQRALLIDQALNNANTHIVVLQRQLLAFSIKMHGEI